MFVGKSDSARANAICDLRRPISPRGEIVQGQLIAFKMLLSQSIASVELRIDSEHMFRVLLNSFVKTCVALLY